MADLADIADKYIEADLQSALSNCRVTSLRAVSALLCVDCDDEIPEARRMASQGCDTCIDCQSLRERRV